MAPKKRNFGNIRKLPSGRFQARYTAPEGTAIKAPTTFASRRDAVGWLTTEHADLLRGTWRDPKAGTETLSEYLSSWLETHPGLRPRTRELYQGLAHRFILSGAPSDDRTGRSRPLGDRPLRDITASVIRQWYSWVLDESRAGAAAKARPAVVGDPRWNRALRQWATANGLRVQSTGRIPEGIRAAWEEAGRPQLLPSAPVNPRAGKAQAAQAYRLLCSVFNAAIADGLVTMSPCQIKGGGTAKAPEREPATT